MEWKAAWSYRPINYNTTIGTIKNLTQRTVIKHNIQGNKVKLKFSNRYGKEELVLDKVILGQKKPGSDKIENMITITSNNQEVVRIRPAEEFYSDEVEWPLTAKDQIVLSIFVKEETKIQSACSTWAAKSWESVYCLEGDQTMSQTFPGVKSEAIYPYVKADINKASIIFGVCEIAVQTEAFIKNITMFGDSITHMSYYSDALLERLIREYPGQATIINRGIGGNRLLHDASYFPAMEGEGKCFGEAAMERYMGDLFENNCPDAVLLLEGVNDLMHPYVFEHLEEIVSSTELQKAMEQIIAAIHSRGAKAYLGTIMPFRNDAMGHLPEAEEVRVTFNQWVRNQQLADGILDFDLCIRNASAPEYMAEHTHIGDGLHPNSCGGAMMADLVPVDNIMEGK